MSIDYQLYYPALLTLFFAEFLQMWGIVFMVTTTLVWVLKREAEDPDVDGDQGIIGTYKQLLNVIKLPSVISYAVIILTAKVMLL